MGGRLIGIVTPEYSHLNNVWMMEDTQPSFGIWGGVKDRDEILSTRK